jgi:hypothetical protein
MRSRRNRLQVGWLLPVRVSAAASASAVLGVLALGHLTASSAFGQNPAEKPIPEQPEAGPPGSPAPPASDPWPSAMPPVQVLPAAPVAPATAAVPVAPAAPSLAPEPTLAPAPQQATPVPPYSNYPVYASPPPQAMPPQAMFAASAPLVPPSIDAKKAKRAEERLNARRLAEHRFLIPMFVDTPLTTTDFGVTTELGYYTRNDAEDLVPRKGKSPREVTYNQGAAYIREKFAVGVAVVPILQLHLDADYTALVGANERSVFLVGGHTSYDVRPGLRIRVLRKESSGTQLGLHAAAGIGGGAHFRPSGLMAQVAGDIGGIAASKKRTACLEASDFGCAFPNVDAGEVVQSSDSIYRGGVSLSAAQRIARYLGAIFTLGVEGGTAKRSLQGMSTTTTPLNVQFGLAPNLDFSPKAALGLLLEYEVDAGFEKVKGKSANGITARNTVEHRVGGGVFYTGRPDLQLGLAGGGQFLSETLMIGKKGEKQPQAITATGQLVVRYFF